MVLYTKLLVAVHPFVSKNLIRPISFSSLLTAPSPVLSHKNAVAVERDKVFIHSFTVTLKAGDGGNGIACFSGIFLKEFAGPDGGNGGNGADILIQACRKVSNLNALKPFYRGCDGLFGRSFKRSGKSGKPTIIKVPIRTRIREPEDGPVIALLNNHGEKVVIALGGTGGRGNAEFLTNENRAPKIWEYGEEGQKATVQIEMQRFADFGIVGIPNTGKSTLLRTVSRSYPRIADYPFTTLHPQLGVVEFSDHSVMCLAEIPGLIEGAYLNRGHGRFFLKHLLSCECLMFMIDLRTDELEPIDQLQLLMEECCLYPDLRSSKIL